MVNHNGHNNKVNLESNTHPNKNEREHSNSDVNSLRDQNRQTKIEAAMKTINSIKGALSQPNLPDNAIVSKEVHTKK